MEKETDYIHLQLYYKVESGKRYHRENALEGLTKHRLLTASKVWEGFLEEGTCCRRMPQFILKDKGLFMYTLMYRKVKAIVLGNLEGLKKERT